ncbi:Uncharacterized protein FKW44_004914 [Caligus rogercresseyi]|uniref:Uncharacterized protein n=1 Tax=Caligus rogercresseyi TaxID=217165 RepID=A0A7T8HMH9_CALRO|nr:Uncharacterized protein FKW44_004914 [Caligus rogercresseyi]
MDEATDMTGKPVVGIYLGLLGKFLSRPFLIDLSETKSHDSESLVIAVSKSLQDLWNGSIRAERIKFIVTQPMPHANEAARSLQSLSRGWSTSTARPHGWRPWGNALERSPIKSADSSWRQRGFLSFTSVIPSLDIRCPKYI